VLMFNIAYLVDEILFKLAMDWTYEVLVLYVTMTYAIHRYDCYLFLGHLHNIHVSNNT
jgi:hypothetical protein